MDLSLKTIFGMDGTGFRADLKQTMAEARSAVNSWSTVVTGAGVAAVVALSKGAIDLASHLSDTSQNLGINVVSLQALEAQHKRNGVSQEELTKALQKTRAAGIDALNGDKKQIEALATLGLNARQFIALPLDKQYAAIGRAMLATNDKQAAYNAVTTLFGEKIGPRMMASLKELGELGLPKVTAEAQKMGQIMSAETIVALDRAGDAIDDFKKRATVAIGNIIVNFRSEEGLKLLGLQFLKVVGAFGAGIFDAIVEAGGMIKAIIWGELSWAVNKFRDGFLDALSFVAEKVNKILPKKFQIDISGIQALKSAGDDLGDTIVKAIANTSPSTFKKDVSAYWDKAIQDQQKVVDQLNHIDLGKEAGKLTNAGKDIQNSGIAAADALAAAGKTAAQELVKAADVVGGNFNRKGREVEDLNNNQLGGLVERLTANLAATRAQDFKIGGVGILPGTYTSPQQIILQQELDRAKTEIAKRDAFVRNVQTQGIAKVERNTDATEFERLKNVAGLTDATEQTNVKLDELIRTVKTSLPTGEITKLNDHLAAGVRTVVSGSL